jgi:simple sugar transport system permease protein
VPTAVHPENEPSALISPEGAEQIGKKRVNHSPLQRAERILIRRESGPIIGIVILAVFFQIASHGNFLTASELSGIVTLGAPLAIVTIGVCILMISGEYDLSVAGTYALAPIVLVKLALFGWNLWLAFIMAMLSAVVVGLFNGLITTRFGIPSFITTLASLYILQGVSYDITGGNTLLLSGNQSLFTIFGSGGGTSFYSAIMLWAIGLTVVLWVLLQHSRYGNWVFASGDRHNSARAMGVPTDRVKLTNFVMCALLAGFSGCLEFASIGSASPGNGTGYELLAIVACVIGGTSLFGVRGTVIGAFVGAMTVATLETGLVLIGAPGNAYESLIGVILVVTVMVNQRIAGAEGITRRLGLRMPGRRHD